MNIIVENVPMCFIYDNGYKLSYIKLSKLLKELLKTGELSECNNSQEEEYLFDKGLLTTSSTLAYSKVHGEVYTLPNKDGVQKLLDELEKLFHDYVMDINNENIHFY